MISRRSTARSDATVSSITSTKSLASSSGTEQVLRKKYKDPVRLREGLDQILGEGQYSLRVGSITQFRVGTLAEMLAVTT